MFSQICMRIGLKWTYGQSYLEKELQLTTGLPGNFNTETNLALCDLADGTLSLEAFLADYGHRGNPDWDPAAPRWREEPEKIQFMAHRLATERQRDRAHFEKQLQIRLQCETQFRSDLKSRFLTRTFRRLFLKELKYFQIYSPLRETTQSLCFLWVELARNILIEISNRTHAEDNIFYLTFDELEQFFLDTPKRQSILKMAQGRKRDLVMLRPVYVPHLINRNSVDEIGKPPRFEPGTKPGARSEQLKGQVVCSGYVSGRARVVQNLEDAKDLKRGEILVAQFTDPAWTPLFMIAGGLVLEQGSSFSHGAIVAREIGLPAIVNVIHGTQQIKSGQMITLDANQGIIFLAP
jgi:pyruvate,water dikinase